MDRLDKRLRSIVMCLIIVVILWQQSSGLFSKSTGQGGGLFSQQQPQQQGTGLFTQTSTAGTGLGLGQPTVSARSVHLLFFMVVSTVGRRTVEQATDWFRNWPRWRLGSWSWAQHQWYRKTSQAGLD